MSADAGTLGAPHAAGGAGGDVPPAPARRHSSEPNRRT